MDTKCLEFIGAKTQELIKDGISVYLVNHTQLKGKFKTSGSFCGYRKEFRVAMGNGEDSMHAFIHEYSHYMQWKLDRRFWDENIMGVTAFYEWLEIPHPNKPGIPRSKVDSIIKLEHDCEVKVNSTIRDYNLPLDIKYVSRVANMDLLFYRWCVLNRKLYHNLQAQYHFYPYEAAPNDLQSLDFFMDEEQYYPYLNILK